MLLYKSQVRLFLRKLKSRWFNPFIVKKIFLYGVVEVTHPEKGTFKVDNQRLKLYLGGEFDNLAKDEYNLCPTNTIRITMISGFQH